MSSDRVKLLGAFGGRGKPADKSMRRIVRGLIRRFDLPPYPGLLCYQQLTGGMSEHILVPGSEISSDRYDIIWSRSAALRIGLFHPQTSELGGDPREGKAGFARGQTKPKALCPYGGAGAEKRRSRWIPTSS
jgi:hypothetical protein